MSKFIVTWSSDSAARLEDRGFRFLFCSNGLWQFENDESCIADEIGNIAFTDKLFMEGINEEDFYA